MTVPAYRIGNSFGQAFEVFVNKQPADLSGISNFHVRAIRRADENNPIEIMGYDIVENRVSYTIDGTLPVGLYRIEISWDYGQDGETVNRTVDAVAFIIVPVSAQQDPGGSDCPLITTEEVTLTGNISVGRDGEAATIEIGTVETGEPESEAKITNSGTKQAAIFDFVIPRGNTGQQGVQGLPGKDGIDGINGKDGAPGKDGANGVDGINGQDGKDFDPADIKRISALETSVEGIETKIDTLQQGVSSAKNDIATNKNDIAENKTAITALKSEATAKWEILNTVEVRSRNNATAITAIQTTIGNVAEAILAITGGTA